MTNKDDHLTKVILDALDDAKAQDIVTLNVKRLTTIADTMIIASGTSTRHVKSIANSVREAAKAAINRPVKMEGENVSEWILVDAGDVIVHIMVPQTREFYELEKLWDIRPPQKSKSE